MNTAAAEPQYRALVVDDEPAVRQATMRALSRRGFTCESAENGAAALEMIGQACYDLVVADLRMPESNGHQLSVDLLARPNRPAILILTGVIEPRISNDLKLRGVDEILFKPIDYRLLAQKAQTIVEQRAAAAPPKMAGDCPNLAESAEQNGTVPVSKPISLGAQKHDLAPAMPPTTDNHAQPAAAHPVVAQMAKAARALETPPKGFDGFANASSNIFSAHDLVNAIDAEPSFAPEVLRFANRIQYKSQQALVELQRSITAKQKNAVLRGALIFAAGAFAGWLLSWLGTGDGTLR